MKTFLIISLIIAATAFATNPDEHAHRDAVKMEVSKRVTPDGGSFISDLLISNVTRYTITSKGYIFWSNTKLQTADGDLTVGFGMFNKVWLYTDKIKNNS